MELCVELLARKIEESALSKYAPDKAKDFLALGLATRMVVKVSQALQLDFYPRMLRRPDNRVRQAYEDLFRLINIFTPPDQILHSSCRFIGSSFEERDGRKPLMPMDFFDDLELFLHEECISMYLNKNSQISRLLKPWEIQVYFPHCDLNLWQLYETEPVRVFSIGLTQSLELDSECCVHVSSVRTERGFIDKNLTVRGGEVSIRYHHDRECVWKNMCSFRRLLLKVALYGWRDSVLNAEVVVQGDLAELNVIFAQVQHLMDVKDMFTPMPQHSLAPEPLDDSGKEFYLGLVVDLPNVRLRLPRAAHLRDHLEIAGSMYLNNTTSRGVNSPVRTPGGDTMSIELTNYAVRHMIGASDIDLLFAEESSVVKASSDEVLKIKFERPITIAADEGQLRMAVDVRILQGFAPCHKSLLRHLYVFRECEFRYEARSAERAA